MYGPMSVASSHTWVLFSLGDRSRLHPGGHRMPHGNGNQIDRQDHSGQQGRAEGSWGAAGQRGKNTPQSWGHRSCCCHSGRAYHTVVPTFLGHTLWNRKRKGVTRDLDLPSFLVGSDPQPTHPSPLPRLQRRQLAAMDSHKNHPGVTSNLPLEQSSPRQPGAHWH